MKTTKVLLALLAFVAISVGSTAWGAEVFKHSWGKVAFETPVDFSKPEEIGMGAVALTSPSDSPQGKGNLVITLVYVPKDMQESMGNNPAAVMTYVKSTYLGTAKPAQRAKDITFLGQVVKGEVQAMTIPKPGELEVYLVRLSGGDKVAVALARGQDIPAAEAAKVMGMVAKTFKESPKK